MTALSRSRVLDYLHGFLKLVDGENKLKHDKLALLNEIVEAFHAKLPYQNFRVLEFPPGKRRLLTETEVVEDCLSGRGGTCETKNRFLNVILRTLGFDAHLVGCRMGINLEVDYHHMLNVIKNCQVQGDRYLADVGAWYPARKVVNVSDLDKGPAFFSEYYLEYKILKENDTIARYHKTSKVNDFLEEGEQNWRRFFFLTATEMDVEDVLQKMDANYARPDYALLKVLAFSIFPPKKAISLVDWKLRDWDDVTKNLKEEDLQSLNEVSSMVRKYCPAIGEDLIERAFENLPEENKRYGQKTEKAQK